MDTLRSLIRVAPTPTYQVGYQKALTDAYEFLVKKYVDPTPEITKRLGIIFKMLLAINNDIANIKNTAVQTLAVIQEDVFNYINEHQLSVLGGRSDVVADAINLQHDNNLQVDNNLQFGAKLDLNNNSMNQDTTLNKMKQHIQDTFTKYLNEELQSYETIKHNNNILNKNLFVRPEIIKLLVKQMINALVFLETNNLLAEEKILANERFERCTFSLIQWYLLHNDTRGINLPEYTEMHKELNVAGEELKAFMDDLNMFLYGL
jgi:hypothetical protein